MMRVSRFGLSHKSASIMYLKLSRSLVKPGYTVIPPSDSRLKLTMSPCFNPTSSTQSLGVKQSELSTRLSGPFEPPSSETTRVSSIQSPEEMDDIYLSFVVCCFYTSG